LVWSTVGLLAAQWVELTVALMAELLDNDSAERLGDQLVFLRVALLVLMLVGQSVYLLAAKSGEKLVGSLVELLAELLVES